MTFELGDIIGLTSLVGALAFMAGMMLGGLLEERDELKRKLDAHNIIDEHTKP